MDATLAWLVDPSDPGVRAKSLVDLAGRSPDDADVLAARKESVARGSVARLLDGLAPAKDVNALYLPKYTSVFHRVVALAEMGAPGDEPRLARALEDCLGLMARPEGGFGRRGAHLCVTGNMVRAATLLGRGDDPRVVRALDWLVSQQQEDGGWTCWPAERTAGELDAWEALGAFAALPPARRPREAVARGLEHLLDERLGVGGGYAPWERLHFPRHYYYDALVGLEIATALGAANDERLAPALAWLAAKERNGRWAHERHHPDLEDPGYTPYPAGMDIPLQALVVEEEGESKWVTLAARRVLARARGT